MAVADVTHNFGLPGLGQWMAYAHHDTLWRRFDWLPAALLVGLMHAGIWVGYAFWTPDYTPPKPLPAVQIALINHLPPENRVTALQKKIVPAEKKPRQAESHPAPAAPAETAMVHDDVAPSASNEEVTQPVYTATYLNNPPPAYPLVARRRGIEGTVVIRAQVLEDGNCHHASLRKSSGHDMLDQAALAAVKAWRFIPARRGAQTISAWIEVPITFRLDKQGEQARSL